MKSKQYIEAALKRCDIHIDGTRAQDITVHDDRVYQRILRDGSLGLGEAYMDGWWDANELDTFIAQGSNTALGDTVRSSGLIAHALYARLTNVQSIGRAFTVAKKHYDDRGGVYEAMLGDSMTYTCGYYGNGATTLEQAQFDKHELICKKLNIQKGDTILDIGCGFGEFARHAAKEYGAQVTGVTVSKGQVEVARKRTEGLDVTYILSDYRTMDVGEFDHVVSIGMFEHVGRKNYKQFMEVADKHLKKGGKMLLHTIGSQITERTGDKWLNTYIFPGGMLPSIQQIGAASEPHFVIEDWHNFGPDYDTTLMEWWRRFDSAWKAGKLKAYDARFYRMWEYYLRMCAGIFRARHVHLWQIVLVKGGTPRGYTAIRTWK